MSLEMMKPFTHRVEQRTCILGQMVFDVNPLEFFYITTCLENQKSRNSSFDPGFNGFKSAESEIVFVST